VPGRNFIEKSAGAGRAPGVNDAFFGGLSSFPWIRSTWESTGLHGESVPNATRRERVATVFNGRSYSGDPESPAATNDDTWDTKAASSGFSW